MLTSLAGHYLPPPAISFGYAAHVSGPTGKAKRRESDVYGGPSRTRDGPSARDAPQVVSSLGRIRLSPSRCPVRLHMHDGLVYVHPVPGDQVTEACAGNTVATGVLELGWQVPTTTSAFLPVSVTTIQGGHVPHRPTATSTRCARTVLLLELGHALLMLPAEPAFLRGLDGLLTHPDPPQG